MHRRRLFVELSALAAILFAAGCDPCGKYDVIIQNAKVWTGDPSNPVVDSIGIIRDRFEFVGNGLKSRWGNEAGANTCVINARGARIVPGLFDSHLHLVSGGLQLSRINLRSVPDRRSFIAAVAERAKRTPKGQWILGGRWSTESWPDPSQPRKDWIDSITPDNPVLLSRMDGHGALANSAALKLAGINKSVPSDPGGGTIERDPVTHEPTGILKDTAIDLVDKVIPPAPDQERNYGLAAAMKEANAHGLTTVHTMSSWRDIEVMRRARDYAELSLHIYAFVQEDDWKLFLEKAKAFSNNDWLRVQGIKGYADGSLGSRTAYMTDPYSDNPPDKKGWRGLPRPFIQHTNNSKTDPTRESQLHRLCRAANPLSIAVHCIGDQANSCVLGICANCFGNHLGPVEKRTDWIPEMGQVIVPTDWKERIPPSMRIRIEHAQHILPKDIDRFARLGVIASMQPYHKADDGRYAEKAIGPERCKTSYAFRSLIDAGAHVAFGSDWPVVSLNPFLGMHAAVTGKTLDGKVFVPEQNITIEEALRCYTAEGAYAAGAEDRLGKIKIGYLADFVVLDRDILTIPPDQIAETKVKMTFVGGQRVFNRTDGG